jgi:hypothetical protein
MGADAVVDHGKSIPEQLAALGERRMMGMAAGPDIPMSAAACV